MGFDLLFPFGILISLVIYLIYSRNIFEKNILSTYDEKYESWKEHALKDVKQTSSKELIGLVFKKNAKIEIEIFEDSSLDKIQRGKFTTRLK